MLCHVLRARTLGSIFTVLGTLLEGYVVYLAFIKVPKDKAEWLDNLMENRTLGIRLDRDYDSARFETTLLFLGVLLQIIGSITP